MKDANDWDLVLNTVEALFYSLALGIGVRADMSLRIATRNCGRRSNRGTLS